MDEVEDEQQHLRARIRCLLSMREIPRIIPSSSAELSACDASSKPIAQASPQYELDSYTDVSARRGMFSGLGRRDASE
jgi:hypothetical protein